MKTQLSDIIWSCDNRCLALSGNGSRSLMTAISEFIWSLLCLDAPLLDLFNK